MSKLKKFSNEYKKAILVYMLKTDNKTKYGSDAKSVSDYEWVHPKKWQALLCPPAAAPLASASDALGMCRISIHGPVTASLIIPCDRSDLSRFSPVRLWVRGTINQSLSILVKASREKQLWPVATGAWEARLKGQNWTFSLPGWELDSNLHFQL